MSDQRLWEYFKDELSFLSTAGPAFAKRHPERAQSLNLEQLGRRNPDVERLVEAFAFLAGQVRAELHDELPVLTHDLLRLIFPHFLEPIPSTTTIEMSAIMKQLAQSQTFEAASTLAESRPVQVGSESTSHIHCRFSNGWEMTIQPIELLRVESSRSARGSQLNLTFRIGDAADVENEWKPLRLHFATSDQSSALDMRYWLLHGAQAPRAQLDKEPATAHELPRMRSVGFALNETVLPINRRMFQGYRLLQEYFSVRSKFFYADLDLFAQIKNPKPGQVIEVTIPFITAPPDRLRFTTDTIRLHCYTAVNVFPHQAVPIQYDGRQAEYPLYPDQSEYGYQLFSVQNVLGQRQGDSQLEEYVDFHSFRETQDETTPIYHLSVRASDDGRPAWYLALVERDGRPIGGREGDPRRHAVAAQDQTIDRLLSIGIMATNGEIASKLGRDTITIRGQGFPDTVVLTNLNPPEPAVDPPLESEANWRFLSHLAMNQFSLEDADSLRGVLRLYNWTRDIQNQRRIGAVSQLTSKPSFKFVDGIPLRGLELTMSLEVEGFTNLSDAYLFSEVMAHFLALYANMNSYVQLKVNFMSGENRVQSHTWPPMNGKQRIV